MPVCETLANEVGSYRRAEAMFGEERISAGTWVSAGPLGVADRSRAQHMRAITKQEK